MARETMSAVKLKSKENRLLAQIIREGNTVEEIIQNELEFRVYFYYKGGGYGSRALVYDLVGSFNQLVRDIQKQEKALGIR